MKLFAGGMCQCSNVLADDLVEIQNFRPYRVKMNLCYLAVPVSQQNSSVRYLKNLSFLILFPQFCFHF